MEANANSTPQNAENTLEENCICLEQKEFKTSASLLALFFLLNIFAQIFFKINGEGFFQSILMLFLAAVIFWSLFRPMPMLLLRLALPFCGGVLAFLYFKNYQDTPALYIFLYWIFATLLTVRMKRVLSILIFFFSFIFLYLLIKTN